MLLCEPRRRVDADADAVIILCVVVVAVVTADGVVVTTTRGGGGANAAVASTTLAVNISKASILIIMAGCGVVFFLDEDTIFVCCVDIL